ncbi:MurR/RpiR family transcriptional regulator [Clostridium sp. UBA1652]|uniref:MurR/RpiR family transcriptional regulator n=1 Tax=Clostridium sp. UBA1652 TaxID=1946348 RepID=UPI00257B5F06|nr:hypothetical protein [Clostridium sp. UBA1652]
MDHFDAMIKYLNSNMLDDNYSRIILYILRNMKNFKENSITDMAELLFISESTITRFCKYFNFTSFKELKKFVNYFSEQHQLSFLCMNLNDIKTLKTDTEVFFNDYADSIIDSIRDVKTFLAVSELDDLVKKIQQYDRVVLFGFPEFNSPLSRLQAGLLLAGKFVEMGAIEQRQLELAETLDERSLAIIISSFGGYLSDNFEITSKIISSNCYSVLLTQHTENLITERFGNTIKITSKNYLRNETYPMFLVVDYLIRKFTAETFK